MIIAGILGLFINIPEDELINVAQHADNARDNLAVGVAMIFNAPWWADIIAIFVGGVWIWLRRGSSDKE